MRLSQTQKHVIIIIIIINIIIIIIIIIIIKNLTPVLNSQGRKIMLCKDKIRKQAGMVFTPPPPSLIYQEVE